MVSNRSALLISSWLNLVLYTIELALYGIYVCRFPRDRMMHRVVVRAALFVDTVCTVTVCASAYRILLLRSGSNEPFYSWTLPVIIICNACSAAIEHTFLTYRIWHLKSSDASPPISAVAASLVRKMGWVTIGLLVLTAVHFLFSVSSAIAIAADSHKNRRLSITSAMVGAALRAATDILIACILVYQINKFKSSFIATQTFIRRFTVRVLATGILAAVVALLIVILLAVDSTVVLVFASFIGRIHSITTLCHLCSRKDLPPNEAMRLAVNLDARIATGSTTKHESV